MASPIETLELESVIGFSGTVLNGLQYTPCGKYILYPLGSIVIAKDISSGILTFFDAKVDTNISCLAISKDGSYLATGHEVMGVTKVEIIIWDFKGALEKMNHEEKESFVIHRLFQHVGKVQSLDFSFDASFLATIGGQDDNDLVVWDVKSGKGICGCLAANDTPLCIRWLNKRNDRFVTCGNYHLRVWQLCTSTPKLHAVAANMGSLRRVMSCISISEDDSFAYVGSKTGEVIQFSIDRDEIKSLDEPDDAIPTLQKYNKDRFAKGVKSVCCIVNRQTGNTNIIAGAGDGTIQLLNPKLQCYDTHCVSLNGGISSISLNKDGSAFIVGTDASQRYSVDISTFTPELRATGHYSEIYDIKFPKESSEIFATASLDEIRVWEVKKKKELLRVRVPSKTCRAIDISPCGTSILSAWSDGRIRSFLPETGNIQFEIPDAHPDEVTALTICENANTNTPWHIVSGDKQGGMRVWVISRSFPRMTHAMKEHKGAINELVSNSNGVVVSASSDGSCIVWDVLKGIRIHALFEQSVFKGMRFHPDDSQYLTCGSNCKITYWDACDASAIRVIDGGNSGMTCLDIFSEGDKFVSGSADRSVKVWAYDDGVPISKGCRHSGIVNKLAISPDETKIVSVGSEGGIFIWSLQCQNK